MKRKYDSDIDKPDEPTGNMNFFRKEKYDFMLELKASGTPRNL